MNDYPDPDEEFELMYGDEFELLKEQEEYFSQSPNLNNSVRNLTPVTPASTSLETEPVVSTEASSRKRSIEELFGDIDDILSQEYTGKKKKRNENLDGDNYALIDQILELRRLKRFNQNPFLHAPKDCTIGSSRAVYNISYQVPKYSFVTITRHDGARIYVRCHSEMYEKEEAEKIVAKSTFIGCMGDTFKDLWNQATELVTKQMEAETKDGNYQEAADVTILNEQNEQAVQLWTDLYKPQKYLELLSDESTNRLLLQWLKLWDKAVFHRLPKINLSKNHVQNDKFNKHDLNLTLDDNGCPQYKIVLLCGPPGLGKTTLAHLIAKHAGYNVVEVNASDDRSFDSFKRTLENATQMRSVIDAKKRPNCLIFDEIDGAPSHSINFLIKFSKGVQGKKDTKQQQQQQVLKRPIICICNDMYVPALRQLRQVAFVVNFPPTASLRLAERLHEITRRQKINTNLSTLLALGEKSGNDIRSCLSVLHFCKVLNKPITMSYITKNDIGQKDIHKGLFAVWQDIFQISRAKPHEVVQIGADGGGATLKNRMQKILRVVNAFGDYERLAQGIFENYPNVGAKNVSLSTSKEALEWFCWSDIVSRKINATQNYSLSSYLQYAFVVWHFTFSSYVSQKIVYPNTSYEVKTKTEKTDGLLTELTKGISPNIKAFSSSNTLRLDLLPLVSRIIVPAFRSVNLHLYTEQEKQEMHRVVSVMIDYNLNYVQERTQEGGYSYNLDPDINEITSFRDKMPKRVLAYWTKQAIAREIEVEKMRQTDTHAKKPSQDGSRATKNAKAEQPKRLPNHLQLLKPKAMKPKTAKVVCKDFFGRIISKPSNAGSAGATFEYDIWYQFKEGYNKAVRKRVKVSSLL